MKKQFRLPAFLLAALPAIGCMALIFSFSAQTADTSSATSGGLIERILSVLPIGFEKWSLQRQTEAVESLQFLVRKGAHFSVYALLGMLCLPPLSMLTENRKQTAWAAWGTAVLYAAADEMHQRFVPGRSCELRDVLIDAAGAALGILLVYMISLWIRSRNSTKQH